VKTKKKNTLILFGNTKLFVFSTPVTKYLSVSQSHTLEDKREKEENDKGKG